MGGHERTRGQSSVVGFAIIVGISMVAVTTTLLLGATAISEIEQSSRSGQAEVAMSQLDSQASSVALGDTASQRVELGGNGEGQVTVDDDAGRIELTIVNSTSSTTLVDTNFGAVVYDTGDATVAYQGGGVWRTEDGGARMISPPEYHYRQKTLTFPIVRVTGESWSGSTDVPLTVRKTGFRQQYPTGSLANPLQNGHVHVSITSDYHAGWKTYFETRTDGNVQHYPDNRTVEVNLTVPFTATFENAVTTTENGSSAIDTTGNANFDTPHRTGATRPSASPKIDQEISDCQSGGCSDLSGELGDDTLENGTHFHDGDITIGPSKTEYNTSDGSIDVVVNGNLTFDGDGGPGDLDHEVTGDGRVTFYVKGDVTVRGDAAVNTGGKSGDLVVLVHSTADSVTATSGTPQFTGLIYAPNSAVRIDGGGACGANANTNHCDGNIVGAVVAQNASAHGEGKLKYLPPSDFAMKFDSGISITYLHVTENRIEVTAD